MRLMFKEGYKEVSKEREMENREEEERKRNRKMGMNGKNLKEQLRGNGRKTQSKEDAGQNNKRRETYEG